MLTMADANLLHFIQLAKYMRVFCHVGNCSWLSGVKLKGQ